MEPDDFPVNYPESVSPISIAAEMGLLIEMCNSISANEITILIDTLQTWFETMSSCAYLTAQGALLRKQINDRAN